MSTKDRRTEYRSTREPYFEEQRNADLEAMSDEELETMLFADQEPTERKSLVNLPTMAGLSLIVVGIAYLFQFLGIWNGLDMSTLVQMLPILAGVLIILIGLGVLSWRPKRRVRTPRERATGKAKSRRAATPQRDPATGKRRMTKSPDKKLAGVCSGIAQYFSIDPTLVRIAFVIGTIASGGPFLLAYIALAFIMPNPVHDDGSSTGEVLTSHGGERVIIIRD
jgi:phage shock protein C